MLKQRRMNDQDNEESGEEGIYQQALVPFHKKNVSQQYTFVLDQDITEAAYYRNLVLACIESSEEDQIRLVISNNGGSLDSCLSICDNLRETAAQTMCIISGPCHSAASAIALSCQQVAVLPSSTMLVHSARYGAFGKAADIESQVAFNKKQLTKWIEKTYKYFLTDSEMQDVLNGKEMFLDSDEIIERLKTRQALQEAEVNQELKRLKKEQKAIEAEIQERSKPKPTKKALKKPSEARKTEKATKGASSLPEVLDKLLGGLE